MREPIFVADEPYDTLPTERLQDLLKAGTKGERARAMGAFARRAARETGLRDSLFAALADPANRSLRFMGTVSIAHIGVACVYPPAPGHVKERVKALIDAWPEPDRKDLLWFLRSQEIAL
jgi:hypothetical protein